MPDRATVSLFGETFRLVEDPADLEFAFLEFAAAASNVESDGLAAAAAVMQLLQAAIDPDDWQAFRVCCRKNKARTERDLMPVVVAATAAREQAVEAETGRPTVLPVGSPAGRTSTLVRSTGDSYSEAIDGLNKAGRPDLALFVVDAQAHRSA